MGSVGGGSGVGSGGGSDGGAGSGSMSGGRSSDLSSSNIRCGPRSAESLGKSDRRRAPAAHDV
jgi:hypothetical protein